MDDEYFEFLDHNNITDPFVATVALTAEFGLDNKDAAEAVHRWEGTRWRAKVRDCDAQGLRQGL